MLRLITVLIAVLLFSSLLHAESELLIAVDSAFAAGQYERVELLVLRGERTISDLPADEQVAIRLAAGYSLIMLGREAEAREYFRMALDADPATRLDPVRISPKFRMVFDEVKASYRTELRERHRAQTAVPPITGPAPRSVLSNLFIPGSGQWLEGAHVRGTVIGGISLAATGLFIWRMNELANSRDDYIREQNRTRVAKKYDRYYDDYRLAWIAGVAAGLIYIAAQTDLALFRKRTTDGFSSLDGFGSTDCPYGMISILSYHW